jgi:hypothetical protein
MRVTGPDSSRPETVHDHEQKVQHSNHSLKSTVVKQRQFLRLSRALRMPSMQSERNTPTALIPSLTECANCKGSRRMRCEGARVMSDNGCYLAATAEERLRGHYWSRFTVPTTKG